MHINHKEVNLKVRLLIKSGYHIVPNPSTTLLSTENKGETKAIVQTYLKLNPCNCLLYHNGYYLSKVTNKQIPYWSAFDFWKIKCRSIGEETLRLGLRHTTWRKSDFNFILLIFETSWKPKDFKSSEPNKSKNDEISTWFLLDFLNNRKIKEKT